eukprot:scaffold964_cov261-Pinguiococcus_pyrenoidosus.AAC.4
MDDFAMAANSLRNRYEDDCPPELRDVAENTVAELVLHIRSIAEVRRLFAGTDADLQRLNAETQSFADGYEARLRDMDLLDASDDRSDSPLGAFGDLSAAACLSDEQEATDKDQNSVSRVLITWFLDHMENPYPNPSEKEALAQATGLTTSQVR